MDLKNWIAVAVGLGLTSCGSDTCKIHMTGAVVKDLTCSISFTGDHDATSVVVVAYDGLLPTPLLSIGIALPPGLSAQTYTYAMSKTAGATVVQGIKKVWDMEHNNDDKDDHPDVGNFGLTVLDTGKQVTAGDGVGWEHGRGSMSLFLDGDTRTGASGAVFVDLTYTDTESVSDNIPSNGTFGTNSNGSTGSSTGGTSGTSGTSGSGSSGDTGGTGGSDTGGTSSGSNCRMAVSDGVTIPLHPCTVKVQQTVSQTFLYFTSSDHSSDVAVSIPGAPMATSYAANAFGSPTNSVMGAVTNGADTWNVSYTADGSKPTAGSFALTLTDIGDGSREHSGVVDYPDAHGTFSADMDYSGSKTPPPDQAILYVSF